MSTQLEDYALIGDGETAALVSRAGSIDWLCWPRFDSDACFAALLGRAENGRWLIGPAEPPAGRILGVKRRYQPDTLIMETDLAMPGGAVRLIDFMPMPWAGCSALVRVVVGVSGMIGCEWIFGYASITAVFRPGLMRLSMALSRGSGQMSSLSTHLSQSRCMPTLSKRSSWSQRGNACHSAPLRQPERPGTGIARCGGGTGGHASVLARLDRLLR